MGGNMEIIEEKRVERIQCEDCLAFEAHNNLDKVGYCHRRSPLLTERVGDDGEKCWEDGCFPVVYEWEWCLEAIKKEEK